MNQPQASAAFESALDLGAAVGSDPLGWHLPPGGARLSWVNFVLICAA